MKPFAIFALIITCQFMVRANETNLFYINDNGAGHHSNNPEELKLARESRESLPAKDFPEGNWGPVQDGFQLSLGFESATYTNGQPVVAVLLLRNVTNSDLLLTHSVFPVGYQDGPVGFNVVSDASHPLKQHRIQWGTWEGGLAAMLASGTQSKYLERLDKRFDLTNGTYLVQAVTICLSRISPKLNGTNVDFGGSAPNKIEVKSAEVKITIENPH